VKSLIALSDGIRDNRNAMKIICFLLLILLSTNTLARDVALQKYFQTKWPLNKDSIEELVEGKVLADATVKEDKKIQSFKLHAAALHPKKCRKALRKLQLFEQYDDWIDFIKSAKYDEKYRLFTLRADHILLPFPMIVHIIVDRPTKPGVYPFTFPTGIFTGLKGQFVISKHKNRCLFYANSNWEGTTTGIPNFVIELFAETLSRIGGEIIIRKTKF
jgi:hypothetical protein